MNGKRIAYTIIGIGSTISLILLLLYLVKTTDLNATASIDTDIFASYGTLIGGILGTLFSLAGIFLLISTLESQELSIVTQEANFRRQSFEMRFFELIKMHRENSDSMTVKNQIGKKVFLTMQREFYRCKLIVEALNESLPIKLKPDEIINISYLCFFFGAIGETSIQILKEKLKQYDFLFNTLIKMFKESQNGIMRNDNFQYKPFEGHQSRLGHYFRHLYQTIKYVNLSKDLLNYNERYAYVKILRAQLSTQEQAFLFINSLSDLGKPWEMGAELQDNGKLITKYNLIKNIPIGYTSGIDVRKYYSQLRFEGDALTEARKVLEKSYT